MKGKGTLGALVFSTIFVLTGWDLKPKVFVKGTVIEEYGNISRIVESSGALFGNESVKLGNPNYGLVVNTQNGKYIIEIDVQDSDNGIRGTSGLKTAYNLSQAIKKGTNIRISH